MSLFSALLGSVGGLSAVMGVLTATKVIDLITDELTWTFWFAVAAILLLASIVTKPNASD